MRVLRKVVRAATVAVAGTLVLVGTAQPPAQADQNIGCGWTHPSVWRYKNCTLDKRRVYWMSSASPNSGECVNVPVKETVYMPARAYTVKETAYLGYCHT